ncbi:hypothetical protein LQW54_006565 [Pestalotiopsis sp. IQ-011]
MFLNFVTYLLLAKRASLQQVTDFGDNASGTLMYIYVPDNLASNPAIVVAIYYCTGTASAYYSGTPYATLAEQYGFIVIYPQSPYSGTSWDSIANMVGHAISAYGADAARVFVTGSNSGAMMTSVLAATYPDVFAAGVAARFVESRAYWAAVAEAMYPGYAGARRRMRVHHGSVDATLLPPNYNETIKQWTGVFGYSDTPQQTFVNDPASPYTRYVYGENVEGVYGTGVGHTAAIFGDADMQWFGIS